MPTNLEHHNRLIINYKYCFKPFFLSRFRRRFPENGQNKALETKGNGEMGKWGNKK
jgi:hypothetical protein